MVVGTPHIDSTALCMRPLEEDSVARLPHAPDRSVTVDDVSGDPDPRRKAEQVVQLAVGAYEEEGALRRHRAEPSVIEGDLGCWVDVGVRSATGGAVELVDIAAALVRAQTPTCPVPSEKIRMFFAMMSRSYRGYDLCRP
jgi:hypothetical protein